MCAVKLGLFRVLPRGPAVLFRGGTDITLIRTGSLGFAGAADGDRMRWINSYRRLLDGLDGPLQVLIDVVPGTGNPASAQAPPLLSLIHISEPTRLGMI